MSELRLLLVEDSEDDALLLIRELKRGGYKPCYERVDRPAELRHALEQQEWDMVITDHNLPGFSSDVALDMVKQASADTPVIIVSGSIGEDVAVQAMKAGAHDYIMKNNLSRLVPAIGRELREAKNRRESRLAQETIRHMAYHDGLTGLANRHEFENRLKHALHRAEVEGSNHILIYMDLDQFKIINDTCGHHAGDELLRQVAILLKDTIRDSDCLARLGGDEFGLLLENCSVAQAEVIAANILQLIRDFRFAWDSKTFAIGASMGMVVIHGHGQTASDLMREVDLACYMAKDKGRNRYHLSAKDDKELAIRHNEMEWVSFIQAALEQDRFALYRQCIKGINGNVSGQNFCEFLIRMHGEDGKLIMPGSFLPAAERFNLMPQIDRWVVRHVFAWLVEHLGESARKAGPYQFFINLSGATLGDGSFFEFVQQQLRHYRIDPGLICFEITETVAITNMQESIGFIRDIRAAGCRIALDDFGSGLSSFAYLKAIPADFLKIDGNFVRDITSDRMDCAIVESINQIARVAGLKTIAEFVEDQAILDKISEIGVDYAQGYGIGRPEPI